MAPRNEIHIHLGQLTSVFPWVLCLQGDMNTTHIIGMPCDIAHNFPTSTTNNEGVSPFRLFRVRFNKGDGGHLTSQTPGVALWSMKDTIKRFRWAHEMRGSPYAIWSQTRTVVTLQLVGVSLPPKTSTRHTSPDLLSPTLTPLFPTAALLPAEKIIFNTLISGYSKLPRAQ